jgi:hypothetical protein
MNRRFKLEPDILGRECAALNLRIIQGVIYIVEHHHRAKFDDLQVLPLYGVSYGS